MKKTILLICAAAFILLCACASQKPDASEHATPGNTAAVSIAPTPSATPAPHPSPPFATAIPTPSPSTPITASETVGTNPSVYSSYAYMTAYDPARGFANFDYITLLEGDEAVKWLIAQEGMDPEEAEWMANEYYTIKNVNSKIRTLDLRNARITVLFDEKGNMDTDNPLTGDLTVLYNLYQINPEAVLNVFFYYVEVDSNGKVASLEQIYTP